MNSLGPSMKGPVSKCDESQIEHLRGGFALNAFWTNLRTMFSMIQSGNDRVQRGRANDSPLRWTWIAASVATGGYPFGLVAATMKRCVRVEGKAFV
ncbi:hypothetical protein Mal15_48140 [Stieleria maiorica]|uniref:Uncharacterized protein n=1 Tax=Stieleria maiorica TaxID=2795974 RepID=A0A5B9MHI1_9BACT|nr:hypothetical protein Mal15_48140 [Stieleria maiorica]